MNNEITSKGLLVVYLNVGTLPPYKSEAMIERAKERFFKSFESAKSAQLPNDITILFLPVRPPEETLVDYIPLDVASKDALQRLMDVREQMSEFLNEQLELQALEARGEDDEYREPPKKDWWGTVKGWFGR